MESKTHEAEKKINVEKQGRLKAAATNEQLATEKAELEQALSKGDSLVKEMEGKVRKVEAEKKELDRQVGKYQTVNNRGMCRNFRDKIFFQFYRKRTKQLRKKGHVSLSAFVIQYTPFIH